MLNGQLYSGTNDMAGEIGHVRLSADGPVGYGKRGSVEGFCSGGGIAQLARSYVLEQWQRGEAENGVHPVVVVNDTRERVSGRVIVRDADNEEILLESDYAVAPNGKTLVDHLPSSRVQAMWLINWTVDSKSFSNHYLAGQPRFCLQDYKRWMKRLKLKSR